MTRPSLALIAMFLVTLAVGSGAQDRPAVPQDVPAKLIGVIDQLDPIEKEKLLKILRQFEIDPAAVRQGTLVLRPLQQAQIQREIEARLKPVPIEHGALVPVLPQTDIDYYHPLTDEQQARLLRTAASVGRIETLVGTVYVVKGTGFVTSSDTVMTNCHVLSQLAVREGNVWRIPGRTRIDFGEGSSHELTREFEVRSVEAVPAVAGLDVAVLKVATASMTGSTPLPAPLTLRREALKFDWSAPRGLGVGLVGFPDLSGNSVGNFRQLGREGRGRFGKVFSPGAAIGVHSSDPLDLLLHVAGTAGNSSGSPVIQLDSGEVIGVHSCCSAVGQLPRPSPLPCEDLTHAPPASNTAVSSWTISGDVTIRSVLGGGPPAQAAPGRKD